MFVVTPDGDRVVDLDHVQQIVADVRGAIAVTYSTGRTYTLANYGSYDKAYSALVDLQSALFDGDKVFQMSATEKLIGGLMRNN